MFFHVQCNRCEKIDVEYVMMKLIMKMTSSHFFILLEAPWGVRVTHVDLPNVSEDLIWILNNNCVTKELRSIMRHLWFQWTHPLFHTDWWDESYRTLLLGVENNCPLKTFSYILGQKKDAFSIFQEEFEVFCQIKIIHNA